MTFKDFILELKDERNLTWKELANESELNKGTLERYGCGAKKHINFTTAMKLVNNMDVDFKTIEKFVR